MELSVIVPVFNGERTLPETLGSLMKQGVLPFSWEVVAVDDGSTDGSLAILRDFEARGREIGLEVQVLPYENGGVGVCRNRGLRAARGRVILYLDADDRLDEGALAYLMEKKNETGAAMLLFDSRYTYSDGREEPFAAAEHPGGWMQVEDYMLAHPCPWNKLCDKDLFTEKGLSFEEGILYEDLAVIPAVGIGAEGRIWYEKKALHRYVQSEGSIMRSPWSERKLDVLPALAALKRNAPERPLEVEYLFWLHLYRNFAWIFWEAGRRDAICRANRLMREHFPHWQRNRLIRARASLPQRVAARLFYNERFGLIRLWKGGKA